MNKKMLTDLLSKKVLVFDGAMGTMLQKKGLVSGECPEIYNLNQKEIIKDIHSAYIDSGAHIIQTNTFGANRIKLKAYNLEGEITEINQEAVRLAKQEEKENVLVAGDIGPTGKLLYPLGDLLFDEAYDVFFEQAKLLIDAGVDLLVIETMTDIQEARAAVIAAKDAGDVPIICTLTFDEKQRTLTGSDPESIATILEAIGVDVLGINCGFGPDLMIDIVKRMRKVTDKNIIVQPNAGLPVLVNGQTQFNLTADAMASYVEALVKAGVNIIGGCCGTTPEHIKAIRKMTNKLQPEPKAEIPFTKLASMTKTLILNEDLPTKVIGECINPTAKKYLAEAIKENKLSVLSKEAVKQVEANADIIDVNVGVNLTEERQVMKDAIYEIQRSIQAPVSIDTVNFEAMEEGLKAYSGKALINSTNGDEKHLHKVLQLAKKYGAAVLGLTLDHKGIPKKAEERFVIAEKIVNTAVEYGLNPKDIFIDTLVLTAGAQQDHALESIKTIRLVKEKLGVKTVLGISNISHGLPNRNVLNSTFLSMALEAGLDIPILNPYIESMWTVIKSSDVLTGKDKNAKEFVNYFSEEQEEKHQNRHVDTNIEHNLFKAIKNGEKDACVPLAKQLKKEGLASIEIVNKCIIPALEEIGKKYEEKIFFLPQLLLGAESAQQVFNYLEKDLKTVKEKKLGTVVIATVKGDIHDIGKNIVSIMLQNHGFHVIDLGKDVEEEKIIQTAVKEKADLIGLSALMTTTMPEMKKITEKLKKLEHKIPVVVGGAVVTESYAKEIGAYYSEDAVSAVRLAKRIMNIGG
ncbi:homocysteine S-methyltransferase family protein [Serpentinicella sp. ANB-PHB4]|uniref:homocysteine S-methyltransferase family protein n=1 Tax=Serpentinicella sp. ANB-PHB4 TaxID=3074076 RepID=UPI0028639CC4|nr:homocysteine S-methyltransferase family protein [Serpentinicella sp. ANB-PHB4]MDR5660065.1 homocysteine S-methyltransferase family protein [Serpentinicella sp. ANB-PHB4]